MSKTTITKAGIAKLVILSGVILCTSGLVNAWPWSRDYSETYYDEEGYAHHPRKGLIRGTLEIPADVVEGTADVVTGDYPTHRCKGQGDRDCYYYRHGKRYYR